MHAKITSHASQTRHVLAHHSDQEQQGKNCGGNTPNWSAAVSSHHSPQVRLKKKTPQ